MSSLIIFSLFVKSDFDQVPEALIAQAAHAVPPIALLVSIELFMMCIKSNLNYQGETMRETVIDTMIQPVEKKRETIKRVDKAGDKIMNHLKTHPDDSVIQLTHDLDISKPTLYRYKQKLKSIQMEGTR